MVELNIGEKHSTLRGSDIARSGQAFINRMEGQRRWRDPNHFVFETTPHNLRVLRGAFPELAISEPMPETIHTRLGTEPAFRMEPRDYQLEAFERFKDQKLFALFSEPGTGKTKTLLDIVSWRFHSGWLTGVLVLSSPKGVHAQWVKEQIPLHLWENVPLRAAYWNGRKGPDWLGSQSPGSLQIFSGNIDMLRSKAGYEVLERFCMAHLHGNSSRLMIVVDESDSIKTFSAVRSKRLRQLAFNASCRQRVIMTGTPIAKDLTDEWSQFYFLDPSIIGHKYKTSFLAQFCIMGGFEQRHVVGHRNLDLFKSLTAPFIFRAKKEQLNLPEKIYDTLHFDLTEEQLRLIREIRDTCIGVLDVEKDQRILASTAATAILRMQQVSCGFARVETHRPGYEELSGTDTKEIANNPRLSVLHELLDLLDDRKVVIWCRFQWDVERIEQTTGNCVKLYGPMSDGDRYISKTRFIEDPDVRYLVATPDAAGKGMDGLQKGCSHAIYYSNSFNAIARWQSEDRIHRIGQHASASYFDLIANGSPDKAILKNLRAKKDLSTLVLDDLRRIIEGEE